MRCAGKKNRVDVCVKEKLEKYTQRQYILCVDDARAYREKQEIIYCLDKKKSSPIVISLRKRKTTIITYIVTKYYKRIVFV